MDTRFWGPSGWKMLHLITFDYEYSPINAITYAQFLESLPYILPCKFCRASLTDYYREYPFSTHMNLDPALDLKRWMYNIHNCVNAKLRKQGLNPTKDPSFADVKKTYEKWRLCGWQEQLSTFWDFLFAVAYNHPKETTKHSKPMPECPRSAYKCDDKCEKNKWNLLGVRDRLYWYKRFWDFLPAVLPLPIQEQWLKCQTKNKPTLECRRSAVAWLWKMRCDLDPSFKDPYTQVCKKISAYSSDCSKSINGKTCRKMRKTTSNKRNTQKRQK